MYALTRGSITLVALLIVLSVTFDVTSGCVMNFFKKKLAGAYPKGCYVDKQEMRDLPTFAGYESGMTSGICQNLCKGWETKYFGLQEGNSCWCGNSFGSHGESRDGCQMRCAGNDDEMCGGKLFNSVYEM